jgi:hypothetical protein
LAAALLHLRPRPQAFCLAAALLHRLCLAAALLHLRPRQQALCLSVALLHLRPRPVCLAAAHLQRWLRQ